jgi:hypothetical protein
MVAVIIRARVRGHHAAQPGYARGVACRRRGSAQVKMVAQVVAILALILAHDQMPGSYVIGQAALWVVVIARWSRARTSGLQRDPQPASGRVRTQPERRSTDRKAGCSQVSTLKVQR